MASLDMQTVLQTIVEKTTKLLRLGTGAIYLAEGEHLHLRATTPPLPPDFPDTFRHAALAAHPHIRRSLSTGSPVIVQDVRSELFSPEEQQIIAARGLRSLLYVPLRIEDQAVGSMILGSIGRRRTFRPADIDICRTISNQASLAIENARLYDNTLRYAKDLEAQINDRKQAESLLRLQSAALNAADNAIVITDRDGTIEWVNPAFARLTGFRADEAVGKNPRDLIRSGEHDAAFFKNLWDVILSGRVWSGKTTNRRRDGALYTEEQSITPVLDAKGAISHFIAIKQDVTERLQSERLQRTVYEVARASTASTTLDELFAAIHRILSQAIDVRNFYIALYDDRSDTISFPYFVDEFDAPPPPGKPRRGLTEYVLRTGQSLLCDAALAEKLAERGEADIVGALSPVWLGVPLSVDGKTIGVLAVQHYSDPKAYGPREQQVLEFISSEIAHAIHRKRAAENVQHSLSLLAASLESTADGLLVVDSAGTIVRYNRRFAQMWRIPDDVLASGDDERALGFVLDQLVDPDSFIRKVRDLYAEPEAESHDVLDFKDGRTFERFSLPQRIGPTVVGRVWSFRDVSENRRLQQQFIQSQKMESLGTLASGIAHDFNNILSIIIGHASELARLSTDRPSSVLHAEAVVKAGMRGSALVRQLLTFARKAESHPEPILVNDIASEIVRLIHETFPRIVTVRTSLDPQVPPILADATQVHQVLLNLCVNARDAMPEGGTLTIATWREGGASLRRRQPRATEGEYVVLSVTDTGVGMNPETQAHIFEPFFSTKEYGKGTGLGLSLVFGIMEAHKGFVLVESTVDRGSELQCCFPALTGGAVPRMQQGETDESTARGTETILVVEDEAELRELYSLTLQRKGYTVLAAADGTQGLALFEEHRGRIALVLSDIGLPGFGGDVLFLKLKALAPKIPVILASGFVEPRMKARLLAEGVREVIEKPRSPMEIARTIRQILDGARSVS